MLAPPPAPAPAPVALDHPKVIDTATLQAGATLVTVFGIEGVGGESARGLQSYLSASDGRLICQPHGTAGFVCTMTDGTDIAMVALINGAAQTKPEAPDSYRDQEIQAQTARRGIWVNLPPPPEVVKHPMVRDTATLFGSGKTYALDGVVGFAVPYSSQLQGYIAANGDAATCSPQGDPGRFVCLLADGTDIAKVALVNGAARVDTDAPDTYRAQQLDALNNRRGYWRTAPDTVIAAAMLPPQPSAYVLMPGDDGSDGITYVGDAPVAEIDGEQAFLIYGDDDLGWGYYDHAHHWHGAPDRFRNHMERFHPGGRGLRGYGGVHYDHLREHEEGLRHEAALHRDEGIRHDEGIRREGFGGRPGIERGGMERAGMGRPGMERGGMERAGMGRPGMERPGMERPGMERAGMERPGMERPGMERPGMERAGMGRPMGMPGAPGMARPGMMAGGRPIAGMAQPGGFMRPTNMAQAGGMRPMQAAVRAAPAPRAAPSGGGGGRRK